MADPVHLTWRAEQRGAPSWPRLATPSGARPLWDKFEHWLEQVQFLFALLLARAHFVHQCDIGADFAPQTKLIENSATLANGSILLARPQECKNGRCAIIIVIATAAISPPVCSAGCLPHQSEQMAQNQKLII